MRMEDQCYHCSLQVSLLAKTEKLSILHERITKLADTISVYSGNAEIVRQLRNLAEEAV